MNCILAFINIDRDTSMNIHLLNKCERNWYHFEGSQWETIKKENVSNFISKTIEKIDKRKEIALGNESYYILLH